MTSKSGINRMSTRELRKPTQLCVTLSEYLTKFGGIPGEVARFLVKRASFSECGDREAGAQSASNRLVGLIVHSLSTVAA